MSAGYNGAHGPAQASLLRLLLVPIVALGAFLLPLELVVTLFIVLGHAHFALAYLYRYKAGKLPLWYLAVTLGVFSASVWFLGVDRWPEMLIFLAGAHFWLHFSFDESFLFKEKLGYMSTIAALPFFLTLMAYLLQSLFYMQVLWPSALLSLGIALASLGLLALLRAFSPSRIYMLTLGFAIALTLLFYPDIPLERVAGFLILLHYAEWYGEYIVKLWSRPSSLARFGRDVVIVNVIVAVLYTGFVAVPALSFLAVFFHPLYFYAWTLLHTLSSIRIADYGRAVGLRV
jgi:hypothetical protein